VVEAAKNVSRIIMYAKEIAKRLIVEREREMKRKVERLATVVG